MSLSWHTVNEMAQEFGASFYLLNLDVFRNNYLDFENAFRNIYPNIQLAYSYKTNYTPRVCQVADSLGAYAEVVSGMEYELAVRIGVPPERIIFNGPYKRSEDIATALMAGSVVNLDSSYELEIVRQLAQSAGTTTLRVGIRCNFQLSSGKVSRFGFDTASDAFRDVVHELQQIENCTVVGLHCHFMVPDKDPKVYGEIADRMLELYDKQFSHHSLEFIDLGGGFFSKMAPELESEFGHRIPTFADYAEAIRGPVLQTLRIFGRPEAGSGAGYFSHCRYDEVRCETH